jgi:hypothetical protein
MTRITAVTALIAAAGAAISLAASPAPAAQAAAAAAYPAMTIVQGNTECTLGYIDTADRIGYSAGHCNGDTDVRDTAGHHIGAVIVANNNRANHPTTGPQDTVIDYEAISLDSATQITDLLAPAFTRPLITEPGIQPAAGMLVCHIGATTGRSCGIITDVYNGWFTIDPDGYDLSSDHGDSGGPVYTYTRASGSNPVLIGIVRGLHGQQLAAVSWPNTLHQAVVDAAKQQNT